VARLSPFDPWIWGMHVGTAFAHFFAGRNHEAIAAAERGLSDRPNYLPAVAILASASALAGRMDQARAALVQVRGLDPALRICGLKDRMLLRKAADLHRLADGLRQAGMPES